MKKSGVYLEEEKTRKIVNFRNEQIDYYIKKTLDIKKRIML